MKNQFKFIIIAVILMMNFGCNKDNTNEIKLSEIEKTLPGTWLIESFQIPKYGYGFYYKGDTIKKDTILYNIGEVEFPQFSTDTLSLNSNSSNLKFNFKINEDIFILTIEKLFLSGDNYFLYFRNSIPASNSVNIENLNFIESSNIFNFNAYLYIEDNNNISIHDASQNDTYIITLKRN